jgi:hypothetical protein
VSCTVVDCVVSPLVPVTVMVYEVEVTRLAVLNPPPHPASPTAAPSEAISSTAIVTQRLRSRRTPKSRPSSGSMDSATGHAELKPAAAGIAPAV